MAQLKATAESFGLPLGERQHTYNSRLAQEVGLWAQEQGQGDAFHHAAFHGYFVDGLNLAKKTVLLQLIQAAGLDPQEGEAVIDQRRFSNAVDKDWEASAQLNIMAAPTFLMGQDRLVGAQSYEKLEQMVLKHGAQTR